MSSLRFHIDEWLDPRAAKGPELRATWARFTILVDDTPVTRVFDSGSKSVRDAIYLPLYPLAEWLATHWWFLTQEVSSPGSMRSSTYARRHSLRYAREGYALPNFELTPGGASVHLRWEACRIPNSRVQFLETGETVLDTESVQDACSRFIACVTSRLEAEGIEQTLLQDEWDGIEQCDADERRFCEIAAAMGIDPFALDETDRSAIIESYGQLPSSLATEFFAVADMPRLAETVRLVNEDLLRIQRLTVHIPSLVALRHDPIPINSTLAPWRQGYEYARALRGRLNMNGEVPQDMAAMGRALGVDATALEQAILSDSTSEPLFDALVAANDRGSPGFVIGKQREPSRKFMFSRSLFEYLTAANEQAPSLISAVYSDRQKRNRAFAAEFLAPASLLAEKIRTASVNDGQITDLADSFGVSSMVIAHQIRNHRLAATPPLF